MTWIIRAQKRLLLPRGIGFPIFLFLLSSGLVAQPLDSLLLRLTENNLELKALHLEYRAALEIAPQWNQLADPEFKVGWFAIPPETRLGPQRLWLALNQKFPWPGKLQAKQELALAQAKPALEKIVVQHLILEQNLKKNWIKAYQLGKQQEIIAEHLEIYDSWEALALNRVENNQGTTVDVYRIQLQQKELEQRIVQLEIEKAKPQAEINRLLNRLPNTQVNTPGFLGIPELPVNIDELLSRIGTDHPIIRIFEAQQAIARQALELNRIEEKPDFLVGLDYFLVGRRTDADPLGNGRDILMPHLAVQIPLNKGKYRAKQQEEELRIQALDQRSADQINTFRAKVETALTVYRRAKSDVAFIDEQVNLLRTTLRVAQTDYANNKRPFDELLTLQDQIIAYQQRHLEALVSMNLALVDLEFYLLF